MFVVKHFAKKKKNGGGRERESTEDGREGKTGKERREGDGMTGFCFQDHKKERVIAKFSFFTLLSAPVPVPFPVAILPML